MIFNKAFCFGLNSLNLNVPDEQEGCCEGETVGIKSSVKTLHPVAGALLEQGFFQCSD